MPVPREQRGFLWRGGEPLIFEKIVLRPARAVVHQARRAAPKRASALKRRGDPPGKGGRHIGGSHMRNIAARPGQTGKILKVPLPGIIPESRGRRPSEE